jgi:hypothetical protein
MTKDRIIEKILNEVSIDPRIPSGIFDIDNPQHVGYMCEYLIGRGIESDMVYEFANVLLEKGKFPERQAYNRNGILVTFPTPEYKKEAIKAGTHFEDDPTKGRPNIFHGDNKPPATAPPPTAIAAQAGPTKTNLPVSTSTATPPPAEKSGEDSGEPAQQMPNAFTTAAPQQTPDEEEPSEPTKLPPPQIPPPKEKEANKDVIKKILTGDDYMLERVVNFLMTPEGYQNSWTLKGIVEDIKKRL